MTFRILLTGVMALALAACSKSGNADTPRALTEYDFAEDPTLSLQPGQVGVTFLEPVDASSTEEPDTDGLGQDGIPLRITEAATYTYGLDPADTSGTIAKAELRKPDGTVLFTLTPASPSASVTLVPGDYELFLFSGYTKAQETEPGDATVFLSHAVPTTSLRTLAPTAKAKDADLTQLLTIKVCLECDLSGANLEGAKLFKVGLSRSNLSGANLSGANLNQANLTGANLTGANLARAELYMSYMNNANLTGATLDRASLQSSYVAGANLSSASLVQAGLNYAILKGAILKSANLTNAWLIGADLSGADLSGANLTGAWLIGATWTDGRVCAGGSIGVCK